MFTSSNIAIGIGRRTEPDPTTLFTIEPANILKGYKLNPGVEYTHKFTANKCQSLLDILVRMRVRNDMFLYVVGDFWYRDRLRQRYYKTAFCRRLTEGEKVLNIQKTLPRFIVVNNPEYEYAD